MKFDKWPYLFTLSICYKHKESFIKLVIAAKTNDPWLSFFEIQIKYCLIKTMTPGSLRSDLPLDKYWYLITDPILGWFCIFVPSLYDTNTKNHLSNWLFAQKLMIHAFFIFWNSNKLLPHSGNNPSSQVSWFRVTSC